MSEKFNPSNPEYKKVEDPDKEQGDTELARKAYAEAWEGGGLSGKIKQIISSIRGGRLSEDGTLRMILDAEKEDSLREEVSKLEYDESQIHKEHEDLSKSLKDFRAEMHDKAVKREYPYDQESRDSLIFEQPKYVREQEWAFKGKKWDLIKESEKIRNSIEESVGELEKYQDILGSGTVFYTNLCHNIVFGLPEFLAVAFSPYCSIVSITYISSPYGVLLFSDCSNLSISFGDIGCVRISR